MDPQLPTTADTDVKFDFFVPAPIFGVDLLKKFMDLDLAFILEPAFRAHPSVDGGRTYYHLRLPAGEAMKVDLRGYGAIGFANREGRLFFYLPLSMREGFESRVPVAVRGEGVRAALNGADLISYEVRQMNLEVAVRISRVIGDIGVRLVAK